MIKIILVAAFSFGAGYLVAVKGFQSSAENTHQVPRPKVAKSSAAAGSVEIQSPTPTATPVAFHQAKKVKTFQDEKSAQLESFLFERPATAEVESKSAAPHEGFYAKEKLPDGTLVDREYNKAGILIGESRKENDGKMARTFYENGQVKGLRMEFADGSVTSIMNDLSGTTTTRQDVLKNGDTISWEYDDQGVPTRRWLTRKGQKPVILE